MATQKIKTFEDACKALKLDPEKCLPDFSNSAVEDRKAIAATGKLFIIVRALNEGWTPDWSDDEEYKYYPWWDMEEGFVLRNVLCRCTDTAVSSRLCFKSRDLAEYAAKQFIDLYKDLYTFA